MTSHLVAAVKEEAVLVDDIVMTSHLIAAAEEAVLANDDLDDVTPRRRRRGSGAGV